MIMALRNFSTSHTSIINKHFLCLVRGVVSALHIPGNVSNGAVSILTPDLSHIHRLVTDDLGKLQQNLLARNSSFHLDSFVQQWKRMNELQILREGLENKRIEISNRMRQIVNKKAQAALMEEIKKEGIHVRTRLKELMKTWWEVEEIAVTKALKIPNCLHHQTPLQDQLTRTFLLPMESTCPNHSISHDVKFVRHSPSAFYLKGCAAQLELDWMRSFSQEWINMGFHLISAPDFVRSLIIDGCGLAFNDLSKVLNLAAIPEHGNLEHGNGMHLVGGSSVPAMVSFFVKNVIQDPFPLRLVTTGRCYYPSTGSHLNDLTNTAQASSIHLLSAMKNCPYTMFEELASIQEKIEQQLEQLNIHFRIITLSARRLEPWEQYRSSIELYSSASKKYVQVAHVSIIGDYICRRLSIYGPDKEFPGFVTAQALSVPKLLACYLENQRGNHVVS